MSSKLGLIRAIYVYLFSVIGLVLVIIAGVRFIDMGLKAWVFTQAEQDIEYARPVDFRYGGVPEKATDAELAEKILACGDSCELTAEEKQTVEAWIISMEQWEENQKNVNYVVQQRQRNAANALAQLIIGLPLYLYHWRLATRQREA